MIAVLLADGFEEIEALTPVDMLRRAGYDVKTVGITGKIVCGSHKIPVICDTVPDEIELDKVSLAVFPGGMPGALNLDSADFTDKIISAVIKNGGRLAAICAAPLVLGRRGLLDGKRATCYPGFDGELTGAVVTGEGVVTDGSITTAKGMGVALEFAKELVRVTVGKEKAEEISLAIMEA
jgi:4-methyl-5(b-hydroxyethyl)-thiazole monophosphate biosynthesis